MSAEPPEPLPSPFHSPCGQDSFIPGHQNHFPWIVVVLCVFPCTTVGFHTSGFTLTRNPKNFFSPSHPFGQACCNLFFAKKYHSQRFTKKFFLTPSSPQLSHLFSFQFFHLSAQPARTAASKAVPVTVRFFSVRCRPSFSKRLLTRASFLLQQLSFFAPC